MEYCLKTCNAKLASDPFLSNGVIDLLYLVKINRLYII